MTEIDGFAALCEFAAMTDQTPKISISRMIQLCFFALFLPSKFGDEDVRYSRQVKEEPSPPLQTRVYIVRKAFWRSFLVCASAAIVGVVMSLIAGFLVTKDATTAAWIGTAGAAVLLWGTLAIRGWEIQTFNGVTLTEKVNRWLFVALYWIGTAALAAGASWTIV